MKALSCLLFLFLACAALPAATWNVSLYDTYGDGWNGATLTVMVNGSVILNAITLSSGYGPATYNFNVLHGDRITTTYVQGDWAGEPEYQFVNEAATVVLVNGAGGTVVPSSITDPFMAAVLTPENHQIGFGASSGTGHLPIYPWYGYSYTQSLYLRSELPAILGSRRISKLKYQWNGGASASHSLSWTVYIGHTARTQFNSTADWVPLSELTQVFQGSVNLLAIAGWVEIVLDRPFDYDGASNLVVAVDENTELYDGNAGRFLQTGVAAPRSLVYVNDYNNPDPAAPPPATVREPNIPNLIIQMDPIIYPPHTESFALPAIPLAWAQYRSAAINSDRWSISTTNTAGGTPNEMRSYWINANGTTRLIAPPESTNGISEMSVTFMHFFDDYGPGLTAKLQYSHDMNNWFDTGWSISSGGGDLFGTETVYLSGLAGIYTYLAWVLEGNHYYYDYWYVDDVSISTPLIDVAPLRIDTQEVVNYESFTPQATVINYGTSSASFYVTFTAADTYYANTQSVIGLAPGATQTVSFTPFTGLAGYTIPLRVTTHLINDHVSTNDQLGKDLTTLYLDKQVYADVYSTDPGIKGPSTFNLKTPGTVTHLGAPSVTGLFMAGADWIGNAWFGAEWDSGSLTTDNYYRINHHTGVQTLLGQTGAAIQGLAWDSNHNILYGSDLFNLYTLNIATGAATMVGSHVNTNWMIGLAYDNYSDTLYGVSLEPDVLFTIDPSTGYATQVGSLGIDINFGQDLAYDREHGYLFLAGFCWNPEYGPRLYWIDTSTGQAYKVGDFPAGSQMVGFAIPSAPIVLNVRINHNRVLSWDPVPGVSEYKIYGANSPYAATFTYLGSTPATTWLEPPTTPMPAKRFYRVTAVYTRSATGPAAVRKLTGYKDPLTGEILDPQPFMESKPVAKPLPTEGVKPSSGLAPQINRGE